MQILNKTFILNEDFNLIENDTTIYYTENVVGQYIKIEKVNDTFVFTTNFLTCPRIAFSRFEDKFIFDLNINEAISFVAKYYPNDFTKEVNEQPYSLFKESVRIDYKYNHIDFIENWSKVIVNKDGSFKKVDYPITPYSVELKDAYLLVYNLLMKYKNGVDKLISENKFIPTLTGGVDTRCLTALWRNSNVSTFYTKEIKPDGKGNANLGYADLSCALKVAERIGVNNHTNNNDGYITLSGMFTEATRGMYKMDINDDRFIYKFIQHQRRSSKLLLPFADDLYLQIKQPKKNVFRCLLSLLLCPDLLDLEYIGTKKTFEKYNNQPYSFYDEYGEYIDDAKDILKYWGKQKIIDLLEELELNQLLNNFEVYYDYLK